MSVSSGGDCIRTYQPDIKKGRYNTIILNMKTVAADNLLFYLGSAQYVSVQTFPSDVLWSRGDKGKPSEKCYVWKQGLFNNAQGFEMRCPTRLCRWDVPVSTYFWPYSGYRTEEMASFHQFPVKLLPEKCIIRERFVSIYKSSSAVSAMVWTYQSVST